jgi:hypothetical protein
LSNRDDLRCFAAARSRMMAEAGNRQPFQKLLDISLARFYHFLEKTCLPARDPGCAMLLQQVSLKHPNTLYLLLTGPQPLQEGYPYGLDQT